jgi:glycosyltransferase involved in cell wall biosynthesis
MKLLVFAHTPPPHHGQSYMVKLMLEGFGGDRRKRQTATEPQSEAPDVSLPTFEGVECYHVNTRFSENIGDMGAIRFAKFFLVFRYCVEAIWCRFRYGVRTFYFAPAPPRRAALYRDWLVMIICKPFFPHFVHHWHAAGLADWLREDKSRLSRQMTRFLLGRPCLAMPLAIANMHDPLWLESRRVEVVPNGIPDPFPDYRNQLWPRRQARLDARRRLVSGDTLDESVRNARGDDASVFRILYLANCFREKGIFETLEGVALAQAQLTKDKHPLTLHLTVAGEFPSREDWMRFNDRVRQPDLAHLVNYAGFTEGIEKRRLLAESDCLCFPTYFPLESFGLVVLEAMAAGLNVIATSWRALSEILPVGYRGFVRERDPRAISEVIPRLFSEDANDLRTRFLERFSAECHLERLRDALLSVEPRVKR